MTVSFGILSMIGKTVSHYRILEKLGSGGMGVVYKAEDTKLRRFVALKFLPPEAARDTVRLQRFEQEARAAAALSHPGVATVHELAEAEGQTFIVFEYVPGNTLRRFVVPGGIEREDLLGMACDIADALAAAHAAGVVHRDLKPENVMRTPAGGCKILDFGLARLSAPAPPDGAAETYTALTGAGMVLGTVAYMAPEQLESREVDFRCDLFSFGTMIYELATGVHPFQSGSAASTIAAIMRAEPPPLTQRNALQPAELERIVRKCLRKRREERYQSTLDLALDLSNLKLESGEPGAVAAAPAHAAVEGEPSLFNGLRRFVPSIRRWWELMLLFSLAFCPVGIILAWLVRQVSVIQTGWQNIWFTAVLLDTVVLAFLRSSVILRVAVAPGALPERVARFAPAVRMATLIYGVLAFLAAPLLSVDRYPVAAPLAIVFGFGAILYAVVVEPMNNRATFPQAFAERPRSVAEVPASAPAAEDDSLFRKLFASIGGTPRRWWELHQLFALFLYTPVALDLGVQSSARISWKINTGLASNWHGWHEMMQVLMSGSGDLYTNWRSFGLAFFVVLVLLLFTTAAIRLYFVCLAGFLPARLSAEVRRLQSTLMGIYMVLGCQFAAIGCMLLRDPDKVVLGAGLAAFGLVTLLVAAYAEPVMVRAAFPQAFAKDEKQRSRRARLYRTAGTHVVYVLLLFLPVAAGKVPLEAVMQSISLHPTRAQFAVFAYSLVMVVGSVALLVNAAHIVSESSAGLRVFRRWFPAYLAIDLVGCGAWIWMALNTSTPAVIALGVTAIVLVLPFGQLRMAREALGGSGEMQDEGAKSKPDR